ncbi:MAG: lipid A deacylase LpxR family protein [Granulosicoccus sp.]|nr:lipid A deacylase LpxR family protein [Granulosicoccus sp.]
MPINYFFLLIPLLVSLSALPLTASAASDQERWFSFSFDNDIFAGTDGGYTNGLYVSWYDLPDSTLNIENTPWRYRLQMFLTGADDRGESVFTTNFGQSMITPTDITREVPDENDIPYAGLIFWQGSVLFGRGEVTDFATLFLGVVGPLSLAEQAQTFIHSVTGSDKPRGWDFQLHNEPLVSVRYGRFWQTVHRSIGNVEYDIVTGAQGGIGNFMSLLGADIYFRLGLKLDSSYSLLALSSGREINPTAHSGGWFVYAGAVAQYVFNNVLFDGNTFRDSPSVSREPWVNTYTAGVATSNKNWGISFSFSNSGGAHADDIGRQKYGSLTIVRRLQ